MKQPSAIRETKIERPSCTVDSDNSPEVVLGDVENPGLSSRRRIIIEGHRGAMLFSKAFCHSFVANRELAFRWRGQAACDLDTAALVETLRAQGAILPQEAVSRQMTRGDGAERGCTPIVRMSHDEPHVPAMEAALPMQRRSPPHCAWRPNGATTPRCSISRSGCRIAWIISVVAPPFSTMGA